MGGDFWWKFDVVVEEFIEIDKNVGPPFIEIYVNRNGKIDILWLTAMFIRNEKDIDNI